MRHQQKGKSLSRNTNQRKNLIRGLITSLVLNKKIQTTETKAKVLKRNIDKMLNYGLKNPSLISDRLYKYVPNKKVVECLIKEIIPLLGERKSGLTRSTKLGPRSGDNTEVVLVEWVTVQAEKKEEKAEVKEEPKKKSIKKSKENKNG